MKKYFGYGIESGLHLSDTKYYWCFDLIIIRMVELDLCLISNENSSNTTLKSNVAPEEKFAIIRCNQVFAKFVQF